MNGLIDTGRCWSDQWCVDDCLSKRHIRFDNTVDTFLFPPASSVLAPPHSSNLGCRRLRHCFTFAWQPLKCKETCVRSEMNPLDHATLHRFRYIYSPCYLSFDIYYFFIMTLEECYLNDDITWDNVESCRGMLKSSFLPSLYTISVVSIYMRTVVIGSMLASLMSLLLMWFFLVLLYTCPSKHSNLRLAVSSICFLNCPEFRPVCHCWLDYGL